MNVHQTFQTHSSDGTRLVYDEYRFGSRDLAVIVPGFWRDRTHPAMQALAAFLGDNGRDVLVLDCRGHGDSGGRYGFNREEHLDVAAVLHHEASRNGTRRIDLLGLSMGGAISISTAALHPELSIRSLLLISPVADFGMIAPRINPLTLSRHVAWSQAVRRPRFNWSFARSEKRSALADIAEVHVPIAMIHMKNDWLVGHEHSERLFSAAHEPKELYLLDVEGGFHADRLLTEAEGEVKALIAGFLGRL